MPPKKRDEEELTVLRLAATDHMDRVNYYEDIAELYGDQKLFEAASRLREQNLVGWGSNWTHLWLTEAGTRALSRTQMQAKDAA